MFEKFKKLFGQEDLLEEAYSTTVKMLEYDLEMYNASRAVLRETDSSDLPFDIKKADIRINKFEREARRQVLTHLTVAGMSDLVPGLVLVSIVIDVERIGDYTKNIYDLSQNHPKRLTGGIHESEIEQIETHIARIFPLTAEVLHQQEVDKARKIMDAEQTFGRQTEAIVKDLMDDKDKRIGKSSAIALALYVRFLKRINAHLTNIASAVVNPFPRISFREKKRDS
jgi:phosphate uptake regulator